MNLVTFRTCLAVLAGLALAATGAWASPAAEEAPAAAMEKEMVLDSTTGEMVEAPRYGGTLTYATRLEATDSDMLLAGYRREGPFRGCSRNSASRTGASTGV